MVLDLLNNAHQEQERLLVVLVDPDNQTTDRLLDCIKMADSQGVSAFFVGGSLMVSDG